MTISAAFDDQLGFSIDNTGTANELHITLVFGTGFFPFAYAIAEQVVAPILTPVREPRALIMFAAGLLGLRLVRRRRGRV